MGVKLWGFQSFYYCYIEEQQKPREANKELGE